MGVHVEVLRSGVADWNHWRKSHPTVVPDLEGADLRGLNLQRSDLKDARLRTANFWSANLTEAKLQRADLRKAIMNEADLTRAVFAKARLNGAKLYFSRVNHTTFSQAVLNHAVIYRVTLGNSKLDWASLYRAKLTENFWPCCSLAHADLRGCNLSDSRMMLTDLSGADLTGARLERTSIIQCDLQDAIMNDCAVYGISAWDLKLDHPSQRGLIITPYDGAPRITLDNLEVAQFLYLLLNNQRIRHVIDAITSRVVLILGRFTAERKPVLDALRNELRNRNYLPVLFDFDRPSSQSTIETIGTLASLARFVIADLTDAKSVLQELSTLVPARPSLPVQPLLLVSQSEPGMFDHLKRFPWVLETRCYETPAQLLENLTEWVIDPAGRAAAQQTHVNRDRSLVRQDDR